MRPFLIAAVSLVGIPLTTLVVGVCSETPKVERVPVAAPDNNAARLEEPRPKPLPDDALLYDRK